MTRLLALWHGDLTLRQAFWNWALFGGLLVNVTTSLLFLALLADDHPWLALSVGYGLSVPYNVVVTVGVWRSANRHDGSQTQADAARVATLILMTVLSLT
ncbi:hypothetical protein EEB11_14235 [Pseudotabrizicola sediminis]|uniref:GtrA-like protein domain-containing protein n=1 Tax=Pseudotabrizicola sediminis TaxID=2486418 RepID=A0ABY2KNN4_9RHOB|nr:hypothetical protein [Pseudotabrizicola sediminis]TGD42431.1 hypothetical protein EEB11_14235 [Pseudotabrizicola sediminis]TGD65158.1 hypothetical protein EYC08_08740 [Tabrizicola sp. WMC-M-20]